MAGLHMGCKACCRGEQRERPNGSTRAPFLASQSSNLSALRRQTVEESVLSDVLVEGNVQNLMQLHLVLADPGDASKQRRGRGRGGAVVVARPTELVERRIRRDSRPRYAANPNRLRPCHRVCSRGSSSRLPSRRAGSRRCSNRRSGGSGPSGCRSTRSLPRERSSTSVRRPWHRGSRRCAARRTPPRSPSLGVRELRPRLRPASRRCGHDPASASPATGSPPLVRFVQPLLWDLPQRGGWLGERAACASPSRVIGDC
jgi:hypothetical protein